MFSCISNISCLSVVIFLFIIVFFVKDFINPSHNDQQNNNNDKSDNTITSKRPWIIGLWLVANNFLIVIDVIDVLY
jgi:hypothetical protein